MKNLNDYIFENTLNEIEAECINEGFLANLLGKLGNFLVKKFGMSENTSKELNANLTKENDALNAEISKVSKGKIKDLSQWWQAYIKENKNAAKVKSPLVFNQAMLKNTGNAAMVVKKMIESYNAAGILNNTIVCMCVKTSCAQLSHVIEAVIKDNSKKVMMANQLKNVAKVLQNVKINDNKDGEKFIKEAESDLEKNADKFIQKYKE
jgi:hypothetical protein